MTVIAWDGTTLAADKRAVNGTLISTLTKIFRVGRVLAAYSGGPDFGEEILAWYTAGHDPATFPPSQRDKDDWSGLLIVHECGTLHKYERTPYPIRFPPQNFALGSGREFALAAMYCGRTAEEAVLVACELDNGCGNGVDVLTF